MENDLTYGLDLIEMNIETLKGQPLTTPKYRIHLKNFGSNYGPIKNAMNKNDEKIKFEQLAIQILIKIIEAKGMDYNQQSSDNPPILLRGKFLGGRILHDAIRKSSQKTTKIKESANLNA
ncbi:MAG: hypothetical protein OXE99_10665 [Cellvibrionales bacterium]|nr:hypothetical protein [Cellvibrionales bacterium]